MLLDGKNRKSPHDPADIFCNEVAFDLEGELLDALIFRSFDSVVERLERLLGRNAIEHRIPELDPWYPRSVNHGIGLLNLTPRVQALIEHPAFRRLRQIKQLGNVDEVYSGASHTRYAHSEGVAGVVCACLQALYHDAENPLFKVLVEERDIVEIIAAGLLHDIGQSDFGHDLEEIKPAFQHSQITRQILKDGRYQDSKGRSLKAILEGTGRDEWHLQAERVERILHKDGTVDRFQAFRELLNGPLDADKLDYLIRDSKASGVSHGAALDISRLLRCLTVLPAKNEHLHQIQLRLGIKEKGLPSSEMVVIVRQKMYYSVYLHHAARALKCMVMHAASASSDGILKELAKAGVSLYKNELLTQLFTAHLTGTCPSFEGGLHTPAVAKKAEALWKKHFAVPSPEFGELDWSMRFFIPFCEKKELLLMQDATSRRLYKRLWERSFANLQDEQVEHIKRKLEWSQRRKIMSDIEVRLWEIIDKQIQNRTIESASLNSLPDPRAIFKNEKGRILLLGDMPFRGLGPGGNPPPMLSDISRKRGHYTVRDGLTEGIGHIWREGASKMMKEACFCRIFCEPEFHEFLFSVTNQGAVDLAISQVLGLGTE